MEFKTNLKSLIFRYKYRKKKCTIKLGAKINRQTKLEEYSTIHSKCNVLNSEIGMGTYIGWNSNFANCKIGRFCSIGPYTEVIYGTHPTKEFVSTHPAFFSTRRQAGFTFVSKNEYDEFRVADNQLNKSVVIGNDVWIGYGVKILEGVTIGDGAIIGAGAVVTSNINPYAICVGVPAKEVKKRFEENHIKFLLDFEWWNKDISWIEKNSGEFKSIDIFYNKFKEKI